MNRLALAGLAAGFLLMSIPQTADARHWESSWYPYSNRSGVTVNPYTNPYNTYVNSYPYTYNSQFVNQYRYNNQYVNPYRYNNQYFNQYGYNNQYFNPYGGYRRSNSTERIINRVLRGIGI